MKPPRDEVWREVGAKCVLLELEGRHRELVEHLDATLRVVDGAARRAGLLITKGHALHELGQVPEAIGCWESAAKTHGSPRVVITVASLLFQLNAGSERSIRETLQNVLAKPRLALAERHLAASVAGLYATREGDIETAARMLRVMQVPKHAKLVEPDANLVFQLCRTGAVDGACISYLRWAATWLRGHPVRADSQVVTKFAEVARYLNVDFDTLHAD